ncbi:hypothetical protein SS50377_20779 [Spironucleus salmonicida]|uniref:Uncharacterized protein n=1 Tax=Spironucleus salmonicida TaxID=348837 RepID=A0A9P8LZU3_9EUKA|nr:hypothetical protein SS50377_20779 [Spironucleus salmonicida]
MGIRVSQAILQADSFLQSQEHKCQSKQKQSSLIIMPTKQLVNNLQLINSASSIPQCIYQLTQSTDRSEIEDEYDENMIRLHITDRLSKGQFQQSSSHLDQVMIQILDKAGDYSE